MISHTLHGLHNATQTESHSEPGFSLRSVVQTTTSGSFNKLRRFVHYTTDLRFLHSVMTILQLQVPGRKVKRGAKVFKVSVKD